VRSPRWPSPLPRVIDELTDDRLLGGRLRFCQPAHGYRVAIDPVLLAAAVPAEAGEQILDAGAGTGAAGLCLAVRVAGCRVVGLELQRSLQQIARLNAERNGLDERVEALVGDLVRPPPRITWGSFHHVMTNPPHLVAQAATAPAGARAIAHVEGEVELSVWLRACVQMLKPGGTLTLIHRAERVGEILAGLADAVGDLAVFPLWPGESRRPAKRVLVQGRKGSRAPLRLMRGLVLHGADGRFSAAAEAVLRGGKELDLRGEPAAGPAHG
jgi:tRNA1(Val) A37 N6-methylase TrmN6